MNTKPLTVFWHSPTETPPVEMYDLGLFWIAVQSQYSAEQGPRTSVYLAHYINKPLTLDENDEPLDPDPHVDPYGDYIEAVGWHCEYDHPDFSRFFQPITFNDQCKLLGWAEYVPPVWNGEVVL